MQTPCLTRSLENMETLNMPRRHQRQEDIKCEDTRVKRSEIPCKLACRRILNLGPAKNMSKSDPPRSEM